MGSCSGSCFGQRGLVRRRSCATRGEPIAACVTCRRAYRYAEAAATPSTAIRSGLTPARDERAGGIAEAWASIQYYLLTVSASPETGGGSVRRWTLGLPRVRGRVKRAIPAVLSSGGHSSYSHSKSGVTIAGGVYPTRCAQPERAK